MKLNSEQIAFVRKHIGPTRFQILEDMGNEKSPSYIHADMKLAEVPIFASVSRRTMAALADNNITTVKELSDMTRVELLRIPGFGHTSLSEIKNALLAIGITPLY